VCDPDASRVNAASVFRVDRIVIRGLELPLRQPFQTSYGRITHKSFLLVEACSKGVSGYGECVAGPEPFYCPETNETALHMLRDFLIPHTLGVPFAQPWDVLPHLDFVRGHPMAKAALEMAVWDLAARLQNAPLSKLLGGSAAKIRAGAAVGLQASPAALVERVGREVSSGYGRLKVKIEPGRDLEYVRAVRTQFPDLPLLVDANSAYALEHTPLFQQLDQQHLMMIEQPLAWDDLVGHAALQKGLDTPICLDESIASPAQLETALELGACRVVNLKPGRVGGFAAALAIHDRCRTSGVPLWCGGMFESGIGRAANVHLQSLPGFNLPGDTSASERTFVEDLIDPPVEVSSHGEIDVPTAPGLGHDIIWSRVDRATRFREEWSADR